MPLAVDGTSRHEASHVHCTLGGTSSPNQPASWWLLGGSEEWATLYAAAQEVDFEQQLWDASKVVRLSSKILPVLTGKHFFSSVPMARHKF